MGVQKGLDSCTAVSDIRKGKNSPLMQKVEGSVTLRSLAVSYKKAFHPGMQGN